jgi:hypothetical protein
MPRVRSPDSSLVRRAAWPLAVLALPIALFGASRATAPSGPRTLTAHVSAAAVDYGAAVTVNGRLSASGEGVAGTTVALQADSYPYTGFVGIASAVTRDDGTFAFTGVRPNRNTRLRVLADGAPSAVSGLVVQPVVRVSSRSAGPGAVVLSLYARHTAYGSATPSRAYWYVGSSDGAWRLAAVTQTVESARLTSASATVNPPAPAFSWRVCFVPDWRRAMGTSASYSRCVTAAGLWGSGLARGAPAPAFPSAHAVADASRFLSGRAGRTAFAVVDDTGAVSGLRIHAHFETASVVKVMMLIAYLQRLAAEHRGVDAASNAILSPMIRISDNDAATAVFDAVGGYPALRRIAAQAGMTDFAPGVGWWAYTQTSAADQARLFYELDGLIPAQFDGYARTLMSTIEAEQSWGVPPVARPAWGIWFKTGALPSQGLFNEGALLARGGVRFALCVLTVGDPSMGYGEQSIEGVGSALLRL